MKFDDRSTEGWREKFELVLMRVDQGETHGQPSVAKPCVARQLEKSLDSPQKYRDSRYPDARNPIMQEEGGKKSDSPLNPMFSSKDHNLNTILKNLLPQLLNNPKVIQQ